MKKPTIITTFVLVLTAAHAIAAEHLVLVPARGLSADAVRPALAGTLDHILTKAAPGTIVSIVDPVDRSLETSFAVPAGPARARAASRELKSSISAFRAAFENHSATHEWERGAIALPEVIRFVRERLVNPGDRVDVVFFGDPKYRSATGVFDFAHGCVPSDAWLTADLAESPYATGHERNALDGWGIIVVALPAAWAQSDWQRTEIERFWTLFAQQQGAGLLLGDLNLVLTKLGRGAPRNLTVRPLDPSDRALVFRNKVFVRGQAVEVSQKMNDVAPMVAEVAAVEPTSAPVPIVEPPVPTGAVPVLVEEQTVAAPVIQAAPVAEPPPLPEALAARLDAIPRAAPGKMVFSLVWENDARRRSGCDIDVWVTLAGVDGELNFREMQIPRHGAPAATLRKDITDARGLQANEVDFEQVTIHQPVNPVDVTLWLNIYNNRSRSPITVALRLEYEGRTYFQTIRFPGLAGDEAGNRRNRSVSPQWRRVDLSALVHSATLTAQSN